MYITLSLPPRQTLLFSATLPKLLVQFAKAGLQDPILVRLDVDSKLSSQLKMAFLAARSEVKAAVLLSLLRSVVPSDQQTVVFAPTKHHVEYLKEVRVEGSCQVGRWWYCVSLLSLSSSFSLTLSSSATDSSWP